MSLVRLALCLSRPRVPTPIFAPNQVLEEGSAAGSAPETQVLVVMRPPPRGPQQQVSCRVTGAWGLGSGPRSEPLRFPPPTGRVTRASQCPPPLPLLLCPAADGRGGDMARGHPA